MIFVLSKFVRGLAAPATLLFLMLATGLLLQGRRPRLARTLLTTAALFLGALLLLPLGSWALRPLERPYAAPAPPAHVDGIIVLGGALDAEATVQAGSPVLDDAAERLIAFVALARRYPQARLIFSGGSGGIRGQEFREADLVPGLLSSLGLDPSRVVFERESRNTYENAADSRALARPQAGQTWLLVTSAWHMARALGCFRQLGWPVTPYPVDYRTYSANEWGAFEADRQLELLSIAVREWIGLVSYRLLRRTDALFPRP